MRNKIPKYQSRVPKYKMGVTEILQRNIKEDIHIDHFRNNREKLSMFLKWEFKINTLFLTSKIMGICYTCKVKRN